MWLSLLKEPPLYKYRIKALIGAGAGAYMIVVGDEFGNKLANLLGTDFVPFEDRVFPDGEICPRVLFEKKPEAGSEVVLAIRKKRSENINSYLVKLYLLTKTLYYLDLELTLVMPYFAYARQDAIFRPGEPLSVKYVAELFDPMLKSFITVTAHTHRQKEIIPLFRHAKAINASGIPAIAEVLNVSDPEEVFVLGPDTESILWAEELAKLLGTENYGAFKKERDVNTGEIKVYAEDFELKNKDVIIVDDMVSTGGTMLTAIKIAREKGARSVTSVFVHAVLAGNSEERLKTAGLRDIISTNTIENPFERADVLPIIAKYITGELEGDR